MVVRFLYAAEDNHQITNGTRTGVDRAQVKRIGDLATTRDNGLDFGRKLEDTVFSTVPPGIVIGEPGTPHDEWRHPTTGLQMTVNPVVWIIEAELPPAAFVEWTDQELDSEGFLIQWRKYQLVLTGTAPNTLTPDELDELRANHRLRLPPGRALATTQLRPPPS